MTIINQLDLGLAHPFPQPVVGQNVDATVIVEGFEPAVFSHGSRERQQTVNFWVKAWQAIGGQSANTSGAMKYLLKQIEELASNRDMQPVYIQWTATADPAALLNASEYHDGWYYIDDFEPDYSRNVVTGMVMCRMTVTQVAAAPPRSVALSYTGGALSSNFSGTALNLTSIPVGASALDPGTTTFNRTAAEGAVTSILSPVASPMAFLQSATISNFFKGGVHVYDTINTSSNPVPTSGGTFVNANWVEVFYSDHDFQGDCVITNGLLLLLFQAGVANQICACYLWNPALATANWQLVAKPLYFDNTPAAGTLEQYSLVRVGPEESAITTVNTTSGLQTSRVVFRLQRGRYECRTDFMPTTQAETDPRSLALTLPSVAKIIYNSTKIADAILSETSPAPATDYGYGAAFIASTANPFLVGVLYQNQPGADQPFNSGNNLNVGLGDTTSLAAGAQRSYGFFAIPYGVSGSYSTANLQQEMESATLSGGFVSAADAGSSGGNSAKLPSGTVPGAIAVQTGWRPAAGVADVWARIRVTANASATNQLQIGWYNITGASFIGSTTYAPNAFTTSYAWYRVAAGVTVGANVSEGFRAISVTNNAATDFWLDEMVLAPHTLTAANTGPQDIYQQWAYDRSTKWIRP